MECHNLTELASETQCGTLTLNYDSFWPSVVWSLTSTVSLFVIMCFVVTCIKILITGQKTRNPQQRRMYAGSRARPSLTTHEPTIYVSPSNLPPPPKYECMAPPSYEEVVGVHYPNQQTQQPIAHPITTALAQSNNNTRTVDPLPATNDSPPPATDQVPAPASVTTVNERQS